MLSERVNGFVPSTSGFRFANSFPAGIPVTTITIPPLGTIPLGDASNGVCGGMVYAVMDFFFAQPRLLPAADATSPAGGSPLMNYILARLVDGFALPWGPLSNAMQYVNFMSTLDHDTTFSRGVPSIIVGNEWPKIKADIDAGRPSPIGLVGGVWVWPTNIAAKITMLGHCHCVLAYGYDLDDAANLTLHVYDPNDPLADDSTIEMNIGNPAHTTPISTPRITSHIEGNVTFRAFFKHEWYSPVTPPAGISPGPVPDSREFDVQFYLNHYPDLKAAFGADYVAATNHWVTQGLPVEGRRGSREFDVQFYLNHYADLKAAFGANYVDATNHWINQGLPIEGRRSSREFDVQFYLNHYGDLKAAFGTNYAAATDHWIQFGLPNEARRGSREFDLQFYLDNYADLKAAFGTNYVAAIDHWMDQGLPNEGRRGSREFDVQFYLNQYADLKAAFGTNFVMAIDHWINQGLPNEGRRGSQDFDVQFYINYYADLKAAFGTNYLAAIDHWINQGLPNEGRKGTP
jgi:phage terminase Nu1 subunit (DNA packaging protein)